MTIHHFSSKNIHVVTNSININGWNLILTSRNHAQIDPTLAFPKFSLDDITIVAWRWQPRFAWPLPQWQQHDYCALLRVTPSVTQHHHFHAFPYHKSLNSLPLHMHRPAYSSRWRMQGLALWGFALILNLNFRCECKLHLSGNFCTVRSLYIKLHLYSKVPLQWHFSCLSFNPLWFWFGQSIIKRFQLREQV